MKNSVVSILSLYNNIKYNTFSNPSIGKYFAIGGSMVLKLAGLIKRPVGDLDIMVSEKAKDVVAWANREYIGYLKKAGNAAPEYYYDYDENDIDKAQFGLVKHFRFVINDIKICVFVVTHDSFKKNTIINDSTNERVVTIQFLKEVKKRYMDKLSKTHKSYIKHSLDYRLITKYLTN